MKPAETEKAGPVGAESAPNAAPFRVLLYNPRAVFYTMPLGLISIASNLDRTRFEPIIVDGRLEADPMAALSDLVDDRTLCLGVSVLTGAPLLDALAVTRAIKARYPRLLVVWGGWHPSLFGRECLDEPAVNVSVQGQGERSFAEIVERLAAQRSGERVVSRAQGISLSEANIGQVALELRGQAERPPDLSPASMSAGTSARNSARASEKVGSVADVQPDFGGCAGIHWRDAAGTLQAELPRAMEPVDSLVPPDYGLIDVERFFALKGRRQLDFIASQGCFWRCAFCADPKVYARGWSGLDAETLTSRVLALHDHYRFDDLNFQDETFFTRTEACLDFAARVVESDRGFTWAATMRADQGDRIDEAGFALLAHSGLRRVLVGVESGSQEMLDWMKKDIKLEQILVTAEKCRRHGIAVEFPFIVGFPGETEASVEASLDFAMRLRAMSPEFQTPIFYFKPYPGSAITEEAVRDGHRLPESLDDWARFDLYGSAGPWVTPARFMQVEAFKFYQRIAWDRPPNALKRLLASVARWRCRRGEFRFPVEQAISRRLRPRARLS